MSLVENLYRNYGEFIIDIPRWEISDFGVTALLGPSGSGKTSTFRLLIGLEPCTKMSWMFKGEDLSKLSFQEKRLGVVFQNYELFPHMTAKENIEFAAQARGFNEDEKNQKLMQLTQALQLSSFLDRPSQVLSGGEKQRVALSRALIGEPRFLFLDEPFASMDAGLRHEARSLVRSVIEKLNVPSLLITHDPADVDALANHIVKIENGRLI